MDAVIWQMLREADAYAINGKVAWSLQKKTGADLSDVGAALFGRALSQVLQGHDTFASQMKSATQAVFIAFLQTELSTPVCLKKAIDKFNSCSQDTNPWLRTLPESRFLTDDFLTSLSRVGTASYLDKAGIGYIQKLVLKKFPRITKRYAPKAHEIRP